MKKGALLSTEISIFSFLVLGFTVVDLQLDMPVQIRDGLVRLNLPLAGSVYIGVRLPGE